MALDFNISPAHVSDAGILTGIAFKAKRFWPYPEAFFEIWKNELTISETEIENDTFFKVETKKRIIAFYSIVYVPRGKNVGEINVPRGYWLDHMFVLPKFHGNGIGSKMLQHALNTSPESLQIFVDPYAIGFYEKHGATFWYNSPSSIHGREIPVYRLSK